MKNDTRIFLLAVIGVPIALSVAWGVRAVFPTPVRAEVACATDEVPSTPGVEVQNTPSSSKRVPTVPTPVPAVPVVVLSQSVAQPELAIVYEEEYEEENYREHEDDEERDREDRDNEDEHDDD